MFLLNSAGSDETSESWCGSGAAWRPRPWWSAEPEGEADARSHRRVINAAPTCAVPDPELIKSRRRHLLFLIPLQYLCVRPLHKGGGEGPCPGGRAAWQSPARRHLLLSVLQHLLCFSLSRTLWDTVSPKGGLSLLAVNPGIVRPACSHGAVLGPLLAGWLRAEALWGPCH